MYFCQQGSFRDILMQIESVRDILTWTKQFHSELADCLEHCEQSQDERTRMAMTYLATHERHLANLVDDYSQQASTSELDKYVIEYLDKQPITLHQTCTNDFAYISEQEIVERIFHQHQSVTALYQYLKERSSIPHQEELLEHLLALEQQELVRMAQGINRFQDI